MDSKLLRYYEQELQHLRGLGGEFAQAFPKIAGRLGLETYGCADPYVERLLEGFSFLAARVQLKLDAEFPRFTNHLLELIYPQYLAPIPSMAIVQLQPDLSEGSLAAGFEVPRGASLRSLLGKNDQTSCEFRTAHATTLWPIELKQASYFTYSGQFSDLDIEHLGPVKAALRLRLVSTAGLNFNDLSLERLPLYVRGSDALPSKVLGHLLADAVGMLALPVSTASAAQTSPSTPAWHLPIDKAHIRHLGFADEHALLPGVSRSFSGYRLLQEYFSFPQRYLFIELGGLAPAVQRCEGQELDVIVLLDRLEPQLEQMLSADHFSLFCTPAINLFPKRTDRIHLTDRQSEYHLIPDRTRPLDYEVYQVLGVHGYGVGTSAEQEFQPLYRSTDLQAGQAYFQMRREQRVLPPQQKESRSNYVGSEVFLALVDASQAPFATELRQLGIDTLCTNRDGALNMVLGSGKTDFTLESAAPVRAVRVIGAPTAPMPSYAMGETAWRLISHLSLNYLTLVDTDERQGAAALRDLLRLYCAPGDVTSQRQIDGVRSIATQSIARRLPVPGPVTYGRGLQLTLTVDESAFEGLDAFLLGAVLEEFFARYVSLNSFTETTLKTQGRGQVMKWPARIGRCATL